MDNTDTINCFNDVKEAFLNTQLIEELALLTPRDIKSTVESWAKGETDKKRVEQMIFEWLKQYRLPESERMRTTDKNCTLEEKHDLLKKTLEKADRYIDKIVKRAGAYTKRVEKYEKDMNLFISKLQNLSSSKKTRLLNTLKKIGYNFIWEYSDKKMLDKEEEIKILAEEIRQMNGYKKTIPIMMLAREAYDNIYGESHYLQDHYHYLFFFLIELLTVEYWVRTEYEPHIDRLRYLSRPSSISTLQEALKDEKWKKRLEYHGNVGRKYKYQYIVNINSEKWAVPSKEFAELYRKILGLTNTALTSSLPSK